MFASSDEVSAETEVNTAPDTVDFSAVLTGETSVKLNWSVSNEHDFDSYRVYMKVDATADLIGIVSSRTTTSYDVDVSQPQHAGKNVEFWVSVWDRHGAYTESEHRVVAVP